MRKVSGIDELRSVSFLTGDAETALQAFRTPAHMLFDSKIIDFLNDVSHILMQTPAVRTFPDVVTFAFWIRKSALLQLKARFDIQDGNVRMGRGFAFHIAPSNVPVNFAYSLVAGLLTGNANAVRVPSKPYEQVDMIVDAFNRALADYPEMRPYALLMRYPRNRAVNDLFSAMADCRVVWGGDQTIAELRNSPLPPRAVEVAFADRYSLAVIDADTYLALENRSVVAGSFYNDTFLSDQNACTSPRLVVWMGEAVDAAKSLFWDELHRIAEEKYAFQPIQSVNKLTSSYMAAVNLPGVKVEPRSDNLIVRVVVPELTASLMDYRDNSGYFYEYHCCDIMELRDVCNDKRCQTLAYIGDPAMFKPLLVAGIRGIDRIVPVGKTMDFDLIWDGYDLPAMLTRRIVPR